MWYSVSYLKRLRKVTRTWINMALVGFEVFTAVVMKSILSSGIWRRVVRWVWTDVSEEHTASIFRVEEIGPANHQTCHLLACWFAEPISSTLKMEAICSSERSVQTQRTTRRHFPEDDTLQDGPNPDLDSNRGPPKYKSRASLLYQPGRQYVAKKVRWECIECWLCAWPRDLCQHIWGDFQMHTLHICVFRKSQERLGVFRNLRDFWSFHCSEDSYCGRLLYNIV
jgi:hypothetical protein